MSCINLSIRQATTKDVELVAVLVGELLSELAGGEACDLDELKKTSQQLMSQALVFPLLAFDGEAPVGVLVLNECAAIYAGGLFGEISELYVRPDYRSYGVAADLLTKAVVFAKDKGWKRLEVGAPDQPAWHRTLKFYLKEGFEEVGPRLRLKF